MQVERTRMYRVKEVAEHFAVSVTTIYRAIESGQLHAVKLGTRTGTLRVTGAAVAAYAQACTEATTNSIPTASNATDQGPPAESNNPHNTRPSRSRIQ